MIRKDIIENMGEAEEIFQMFDNDNSVVEDNRFDNNALRSRLGDDDWMMNVIDTEDLLPEWAIGAV